MKTPIVDFVEKYSGEDFLRLHMPGHKGVDFLGMESSDITEINGADSLYEADGIIKESENNASALFGADTFYSTEGSSLCIRAMLYLACLKAKEENKKPLIMAGRNAHKSFLSANILLDFDVEWIYSDSYLSCKTDAEMLKNFILSSKEKPTAVYLTSPDYLGNTVDLKSIAEICHKNDILLLVDNAHGAYLKFLNPSQHPIDSGADMCCDSAHKTLPVLTGGAYLHISRNAPAIFKENAKNALALFGSTSPSYLILQSLDMANRYIADGYKEKLCEFAEKVADLKNELINNGFSLSGNEPLKITIETKPIGYYADEFAKILSEKKIICEFADKDYIVFMLTPEIGKDGLKALENALKSIPFEEEIKESPPPMSIPEKALSAREASFIPSEFAVVENCNGRILASAAIGCPPAVPIVMCGEIIDDRAIECFKYYGIKKCRVVK